MLTDQQTRPRPTTPQQAVLEVRKGEVLQEQVSYRRVHGLEPPRPQDRDLTRLQRIFRVLLRAQKR